jgi:hypothetical protein
LAAAGKWEEEGDVSRANDIGLCLLSCIAVFEYLLSIQGGLKWSLP